MVEIVRRYNPVQQNPDIHPFVKMDKDKFGEYVKYEDYLILFNELLLERKELKSIVDYDKILVDKNK